MVKTWTASVEDLPYVLRMGIRPHAQTEFGKNYTR